MNNPNESPRFTFFADNLRGIEGQLENVPIGHVLNDVQSGRPVNMSVIKNRLAIDVTFILAIKSVANDFEEDLVSNWEEAV